MSFAGFVAGGTATPAVKDDFNRANSTTPGLSWNEPLFTGEFGAQILSNAMAHDGPNTLTAGGVYWGSDESSADLALCATLVAAFVTDDANVSLYSRIPAAGLPMTGAAAEDAYRVTAIRVTGANNDELRCYEILNGAHNQLTPSSGANSIGADWAAGDKFGYTIRETGGTTEITCWRLPSGGTWAQTSQFISSTAGRGTAAGRTGVEFNANAGASNQPAIDDLCVEDWVPSAPQAIRPDADTTTTGWTSTPLFSKINEASADGTVITATAS